MVSTGSTDDLAVVSTGSTDDLAVVSTGSTDGVDRRPALVSAG